MDRRKFIKGVAIIPAGLIIERFLPETKSDFKNFMNLVYNDVRKNSGIPKEIFDMEFNRAYSLSREIGRLEKIKLPPIEYT